jgi:carboxyl-terminal processing protease
VPLFSGAGEEHEQALKESLSEKLAAAHSLVLDFRDGWGGCNPTLVNLFNRAVPRLTSVNRDGKELTLDSQWRKPLVLLINGGTRSGKEAVAFALQEHQRATLVGERTAGAVLAGRCFPLPDGSLLYLAVADVRVDGERLEGRGVMPDVEVADALPFAQGTDPQLQKALELAATLE